MRWSWIGRFTHPDARERATSVATNWTRLGRPTKQNAMHAMLWQWRSVVLALATVAWHAPACAMEVAAAAAVANPRWADAAVLVVSASDGCKTAVSATGVSTSWAPVKQTVTLLARAESVTFTQPGPLGARPGADIDAGAGADVSAGMRDLGAGAGGTGVGGGAAVSYGVRLLLPSLALRSSSLSVRRRPR